MEIIKTTVKLDSDLAYFTKHLEIINPFMPVHLTSKEIEVLAAFMSFTGDLVDKDRFGTTFRSEVKANLNLSSGGLSNHIKSLKQKKAIYKEGEVLKIKDFLFPEDKTQKYQFVITK